MDQEFKYDAFISYAHVDHDVAHDLVTRLTLDGLQVWFDERAMETGSHIHSAIDKALTASRKVVVCVSMSALQSAWVRAELGSILNSDPTNEKRRCILLRLDDGRWERGLLEALKFVDWKPAARETSYLEVLDACRPTVHSNSKRHEDGDLPRICNISQLPNAHLCGRDEPLHEIHARFTSNERGSHTRVICGLGGIGKSQLALEYAYRYSSSYDAIWWLWAEDEVALRDGYWALAEKLGLEFERDGKTEEQLIHEVRQELGHVERLLLIFDNATGPLPIRRFRPLGAKTRVLITSRHPTWQDPNVTSLSLLTSDAAEQFLCARTSRPLGSPYVGAVAARLGYLPLALEQAASYLQATKITFEKYAAMLEKSGLRVLEKGAPLNTEENDGRPPKTVMTTWQHSVDAVMRDCPEAVQLLQACSFLGPDPIWIDDVVAARQHLPRELSTALGDEDRTVDLQGELFRYSLVTRGDGDSIQIHRLVSEVTRHNLASGQAQWAAAMLEMLTHICRPQPEDSEAWARSARWLGHVRFATKLLDAERLGAISSENELVRRVVRLSMVALELQSRTKREDFKATHEQCIALINDSGVSLDEGTKATLEFLQGEYLRVADLPGADRVLSGALSRFEKAGDTDGITKVTLSLGYLEASRDPNAALSYLERAIPLLQPLGAELPASSRRQLHNARLLQAQIQMQRGELAKARSTLKQMSGSCRQEATGQLRARVIRMLGLIQMRGERPHSARRPLAVAVRSFERLESEISQTPISRGNALCELGLVHARRGRLDEAQRAYSAARACYEKEKHRYGTSHVSWHEADLARRRGQRTHAIELFERSQREHANREAEGEAALGKARVELAFGVIDRAEAYLEDAESKLERIDVQNQVQCILVAAELALVAGKYERARAELQKWDAKFGASELRAFEVRRTIAEIRWLRALGDIARARELATGRLQQYRKQRRLGLVSDAAICFELWLMSGDRRHLDDADRLWNEAGDELGGVKVAWHKSTLGLPEEPTRNRRSPDQFFKDQGISLLQASWFRELGACQHQWGGTGG